MDIREYFNLDMEDKISFFIKLENKKYLAFSYCCNEHNYILNSIWKYTNCITILDDYKDYDFYLDDELIDLTNIGVKKYGKFKVEQKMIYK